MSRAKKFAAVLTAAATTAAMAVPAMAAGDPIKDLYTYEIAANEMETFNILHSQAAVDLNVLTNCIEGLVSADTKGQLVPAVAESWEQSDDGLTWTFHIREGVKWVDVNGNEMADCTAQDFVTGLEWILNSAKNGAANTSMPSETIEGAADYYEYTAGLSEDEAKALTTDGKFAEMVGVKAVDDYTLEYTCTANMPYFPTVAAYNCLYPASQALIDELGVDGFLSCTNENMWYNGCYTVTDYIQGNEKVLTKNESYWDTDCTLFDTVTIKMVESTDTAFQLYQNGEIDNVALTESNLNMLYNDAGSEYNSQLIEMRPTKYSYGFHFNYDKYTEDGAEDTNWNTAISNEAFRQCFYYGLELGNYYKRTNAINPYTCYNNAYTMKGLVYTSDGTEYTQLVQQNLGLEAPDGTSMTRLDADKFAELKKQAMDELSAKGVTFPVSADYYIPASSQTSLDSANVLKQAFTDSFGDDFIVLNIGTYVSSFSQEVRNAKKQAFALNGWGADYGDPQNYLGQEIKDNDNAYYAVYYANIAENDDEELNAVYDEFTKLVNEANAITDDLDKRYEAYAKAEAYMIEHALVVPCSYSVGWELTHINDYSKINALYGIQNTKYKNWETSVDAYTTEEYAAFAEAANN